MRAPCLGPAVPRFIEDRLESAPRWPHTPGMKWLSYIAGAAFFALGLVVAATDVADAGRPWSRIGEVWFQWSPSSLQSAEPIISRYIDPCGLFRSLDCAPFLWHPAISWILTGYAAPSFLAFGFALLLAGRWLSRRRRG